MAHDTWTVPLHLSNFNIAVTVLGAFVSLFSLVSYLLKEHYYLSEALISLLAGVALGPNGFSFIRPEDYAGCNENGSSSSAASDCRKNLSAITLDFSRLVLAVQLVLAGVLLPSKYLIRECRSVLLLVGPGMTAMWLTTSLLVGICVGTPSFLHALAIGACVTPTDPVLSTVIVKGRFADRNISRDLQDLIIAESGLNDGLGYPFLFFALYLIKFIGAGAGADSGGVIDAMGRWLVATWFYTILLSILYGAVVGWAGKKLLHWAKERNYVDRESFLIFPIALALFVLGTCGLVGTDDVLACFIAGNAFTWDGDDWFRLQIKDDSLQPTVDMMLNVTIFLWYGASLPWSRFADSSALRIPTWQYFILGALVLLLRRLPWVFIMRRWIPQITETRQALFAGFFGPMGVSAVFYLLIAEEFIDAHLSDGNGGPRSDVADLTETMRLVVWFLTLSSIVIHGLSVPFGKAGYRASQSLGRALSVSHTTDTPVRVAWCRIPVLSKYLGDNSKDIESFHVRTGAGISGPATLQPRDDRSEVDLLGDLM
ncbi:Cation/H+ exchanger [Aspergillus egyptiacus]|nr:Cation/H+ exchanger [Aspergillus egyptiacus]